METELDSIHDGVLLLNQAKDESKSNESNTDVTVDFGRIESGAIEDVVVVGEPPPPPDNTQEISVYTTYSSNVLVLGLSGAGKTGLLSNIRDETISACTFDSKLSPEHVTKRSSISEPFRMRNKKHKMDINVTMADTIGIDDNVNGFDKVKQDIMYIVEVGSKRLNSVIVLISYSKWRSKMDDALLSLLNFIEKSLRIDKSHVLICISFSDMISKESRRRFAESILNKPSMEAYRLKIDDFDFDVFSPELKGSVIFGCSPVIREFKKNQDGSEIDAMKVLSLLKKYTKHKLLRFIYKTSSPPGQTGFAAANNLILSNPQEMNIISQKIVKSKANQIKNLIKMEGAATAPKEIEVQEIQSTVIKYTDVEVAETNIQIDKIMVRNMFVMGRVGSGKSSLINLLGVPTFKEMCEGVCKTFERHPTSPDANPTTNEIKTSHPITVGSLTMRLIDTPGLYCDQKTTIKENFENVTSSLLKEMLDLDTYHIGVLVMRLERLRQEEDEIITMFYDLCINWKLTNSDIYIMITHSEFLSEGALISYLSIFKSRYSKIDVNIIFVCTININEVDPLCRRCYHHDLFKSRTKIFNAIAANHEDRLTSQLRNLNISYNTTPTVVWNSSTKDLVTQLDEEEERTTRQAQLEKELAEAAKIAKDHQDYVDNMMKTPAIIPVNNKINEPTNCCCVN